MIKRIKKKERISKGKTRLISRSTLLCTSGIIPTDLLKREKKKNLTPHTHATIFIAAHYERTYRFIHHPCPNDTFSPRPPSNATERAVKRRSWRHLLSDVNVTLRQYLVPRLSSQREKRKRGGKLPSTSIRVHPCQILNIIIIYEADRNCRA